MVLLDEEALLPDPAGGSDHAEFTFQVEPETLGAWTHVVPSSKEAEFMYGILEGPQRGCTIEVPSFGWAMGSYTNQGWLQLHEEGLYHLDVYGNSSSSYVLIHVTITTVPHLDELPSPVRKAECTLDNEACACVQESCNCEPL